ncbi:alpha/beta hydrolase fold domain-containing protein [Streptomyces albidus (ex Kaewkla and Franco 2022)]|uniref:alpha/beta hydrolase fold domain-containing protein n=1 Tax=Streptomyces albidus (ex Kaewkla and Franco 2022) TaxID=722709 RepID=UPI001F45A40C|nr:alpha/beta hydrolase [Streptomyces albidus (ex Kaewkla and Franco 2022)]
MGSRALKLVMSAVGKKLGYRDLTEVRRKVEKQLLRPASYKPPKHLDKSCVVHLSFEHGWPCYRISPRGRDPKVQVLYLHGGAYIEEIGSNHWALIKELATNVPAAVTVPVYPLAPRGTASRFLPAVTALAGSLTTDSALPTVFMGDSAGGGLALAIAQRLRDAATAPPARLVLISPWLDVALGNPEAARVQPRDPMLSTESLRYTGALWADERELSDAAVSPINGTMTGLPPTTVYVGTDDVLCPDARRFRDMATSAGVAVDFHEAAGQIHVYPLWPIREGRHARRCILDDVGHATTR